MDTSFTNSRESLASAKICQTDWSRLDRAEQIRSVEMDGFVVLPDLVAAEDLAVIREELDRLETTAVDYSEYQRGHRHVIASNSPTAIRQIANPDVIAFLTELFGDELICTSCGYSLALPGHPGIVLHTDSQPYGSKIFGKQASAPVLARVLYYLDDLTPECSPFKVIPGSHLSMHRDGNPYRRYLRHPDEVMITCKAGSAAIINQKVFHGNFPNHSDSVRRMLAAAYRPAWAGPIDEVTEFDPEELARLPEEVKPYFGSRNTQDIDFDIPNRPDNLRTDAPGISPQRWTGDGHQDDT